MSQPSAQTVDSSDKHDDDPSEVSTSAPQLRPTLPPLEGAESNVFFRGEDFRKLPPSMLADLAAAESNTTLPMPPMKGEPAKGEDSSMPSVKTPLDVTVQDQAYDIEILQEQNVTMASQVALISDQLAQAMQLLMNLQSPAPPRDTHHPPSDSMSMHTGDLRAGTIPPRFHSSYGITLTAVHLLRATTNMVHHSVHGSTPIAIHTLPGTTHHASSTTYTADHHPGTTQYASSTTSNAAHHPGTTHYASSTTSNAAHHPGTTHYACSNTTTAAFHPGTNTIATGTTTTTPIPLDDFDLDLPSDLYCVRTSLLLFYDTIRLQFGESYFCANTRRESGLSLCAHVPPPRRFIFIFVFQLPPDMELGSDTSKEALAPSMIRTHLIPPSSRNYMDGQLKPHSSLRPQDVAYHRDFAAPKPTKDTEKELRKFIAGVDTIHFNGDGSSWPVFEEAVVSFLRAHGISSVLQEGCLASPQFDPLHNMALYQFLFKCVKQNVAVFAVLRRAPSGDGHTGYCFLSEQCGVRDFAAIQAYIQFFQPYESELPLAAALRLEGLYDELDMAGKPTPDWERVEKLLTVLSEFPKFSGVYERLEEASSTRGITYKEASTAIGKRQTTLDKRTTLANIVPRSRPVYQMSQQSMAPANPPPQDAGSSSAEVPGSSPAEVPAPPWVSAFLAATHRKGPTGGPPPREPCTQTPGLKLKRVAGECRVDGCKTPSRSRLCNEHALQLSAQKVKFLPCTTNGETRYAYYVVQPAEGSKPAWQGMLIKDEAAHRKITGE